MSTQTKAVTNDDLMTTMQDLMAAMQDIMQMTSEGFEKLDKRINGLEGHMDELEGETRTLKGEIKDLTQASYRHELRLGELAGTHDKLNDLIHIDIKEILHRLAAIENQLPTINEAEVRKLQLEMQTVVDWVAKVSKLKNIAIKFPS